VSASKLGLVLCCRCWP